jgi:hypothetical protein
LEHVEDGEHQVVRREYVDGLCANITQSLAIKNKIKESEHLAKNILQNNYNNPPDNKG